MGKYERVIKSSGNVFADLNVPNPDTALRKAKSAFRINKIVAQRGLKQTEAAAKLGIDQANVSALRNGKLAGFSTDCLLRMLNRLGQDIEFDVRAKPNI